jgi:hypothetical protein
MRATLLALTVALLAPAAARADFTLRLERFEAPAAPAALHLDVPSLEVDGHPELSLLAADRGRGSGRGARVEPAISLILGIIPGFGLGHLLAGSEQWVIWLIADIVIFAVWPGGFFFFDGHGAGYGLLGLLVLVERIFEGISAYQAAGGGPILRDVRGWGDVAPSALALPVGTRGAFLR